MICGLCRQEISSDTKTVVFHLDGHCQTKTDLIEVIITSSSRSAWEEALRILDLRQDIEQWLAAQGVSIQK